MAYYLTYSRMVQLWSCPAMFNSLAFVRTPPTSSENRAMEDSVHTSLPPVCNREREDTQWREERDDNHIVDGERVRVCDMMRRPTGCIPWREHWKACLGRE